MSQYPNVEYRNVGRPKLLQIRPSTELHMLNGSCVNSDAKLPTAKIHSNPVGRSPSNVHLSGAFVLQTRQKRGRRRGGGRSYCSYLR